MEVQEHPGHGLTGVLETEDQVAEVVGIRDELRPEASEAITALRAQGVSTVIGDGINDAPALASATVGIAMGVTGSAAAVESADVAFTGTDLRLIPDALAHAKRGRAIMTGNIALALAMICTAALVLVGFLDFECEACIALYPVIEDLRDEQGEFEAMYHRLFETDEEWGHQETSQRETFFLDGELLHPRASPIRRTHSMPPSKTDPLAAENEDAQVASGARPERGLGALLLVSGFIGLVAAVVLLMEKMELLADPDYIPSCNINPALSCGSEMTTPQAEAFGIPNPILGIAGFAAVATIGAILTACYLVIRAPIAARFWDYWTALL